MSLEERLMGQQRYTVEFKDEAVRQVLERSNSKPSPSFRSPSGHPPTHRRHSAPTPTWTSVEDLRSISSNSAAGKLQCLGDSRDASRYPARFSAAFPIFTRNSRITPIHSSCFAKRSIARGGCPSLAMTYQAFGFGVCLTAASRIPATPAR